MDLGQLIRGRTPPSEKLHLPTILNKCLTLGSSLGELMNSIFLMILTTELQDHHEASALKQSDNFWLRLRI
jgi:hypothetical protein